MLRIKPHAPPLVRVPSIPLSFNLAVVLRRVLNALAAALRAKPLTLSTHRLRRGLPGYLILFDPRFRTSASVTDQKVAFATGVPPYLCAFHRYTLSSSALKFSSFNDPPRLSRGLSSDLKPPTRALRRITLATYVLPRLLA